MKITDYEWNKFISRRKLDKYKKTYADLFKIKDAIVEANANESVKVIVTMGKKRNNKEFLGIAGQLDYWWVIDFVVEANEKVILLYRNCKIHGQTDPQEFWKDTLIQLENGFNLDTSIVKLENDFNMPMGMARKRKNDNIID